MASFKSVLSAVGADAKKVFAFISSPKGQAVIATGETAIEVVDPAASGLVSLANAGLTEILKVEGLAAAAGQQDGTGSQKLAAVVQAVTPEVLAYAEKSGFPNPSGEQIQNAVNALVAFGNALSAEPAK